MIQGSAVVIGGSGGIGQAICRSLAAEGAPVMVGYRTRREPAERIRDELRATGQKAEIAQCDVTDRRSVQGCLDAATSAFGDLGTIVLASGPNVEQTYVSELSDTALRAALEADVIGFLALIQLSLPILRARGGGSIVALSSIAVHGVIPRDVLGGVPKSAVEMLCRSVAKEEGRHNIRINSVAPGFIEAGLGQKYIEELYTPEVWQRQRMNTPLRRFGQASEVAEVVAFLASTRASYMTGQNLVVDGGYCL